MIYHVRGVTGAHAPENAIAPAVTEGVRGA